jgi:glycosyltransferase involved in cell wall biosynthesis
MHHRAKYVKAVLPQLKDMGVEIVQQVSKDRILKELCEADVLSYPIDTVRYSECHPVSVLEAAAAGCRLVLHNSDNQKSLFGPIAMWPDIDKFGEAVIMAIKDPLISRDAGIEFAKDFSIEKMCAKWDDLFKRLAIGELQ